MDFKLVFSFLIDTFEREKIDFALIGGFALQAAGITRTTKDIDLLILAQDSVKIKKALLSRGYELLHESKDVLNFLGKKPDLGKIDFLLAHRKYALGMLDRAVTRPVFDGKLRVKTIGKEDLIGLKLQSSVNDPSRYYQDMADIFSLIRENYGIIDINLVREYFEVFNKTDELEKIIEQVKDAHKK
ncbi:MAG: hypothetical protein HQL30_06515 [Candidatus Omnitrophica bacterium]|nr:hypothetical protein [Candidatus Omnitrophota bacterium]